MIAAILAICTVCAAGVQAVGGNSPDFVRSFALNAVHYRAERDNQADGSVGDLYVGLKYFTKSSPTPFWAVLPRRAAARAAGDVSVCLSSLIKCLCLAL